MANSRYEAVIAFVLFLDRDILLYILPIDLFFSIALVALLSRGRRPLELLSLFAISFVVLFVLVSLLFRFAFQRPFFLLDAYSFP
ncbi:MAG: hypothetical protein JW797_17335 [Bradymonadales bacterium]|nr:hypothetical protein [Bradymonadales bacterium]